MPEKLGAVVIAIGARNTVEPVGAATFEDEYFGEFEGPLTKPAKAAAATQDGQIVAESHDGIVITREGAVSTLALASQR